MSYPSFKSSARRSPLSGFTLVELLTVIAIIGILAAILLPVINKVRATVQNTKCQNNLRMWSQAVLLYANDHKGNYALRARESEISGKPYWTTMHTNVNKTLYGPYFAGGASALEAARSCPLYPAPETGNSEITYQMNRPYLDAKKNVAAAEGINLRSVAKPSQLLLMAEIDTVGSGDYWFIGKSALQTQTNALFAPDRQRHALTSNAVFVDGHVSAITAADIEKNGDVWTRMDGGS